jgi:CDP-diacylglycerol---glycerol-3-phosphate 3-phosphatidyltransferase
MSRPEPLSANVTTAPGFWNVPNTLTVSRLVLALCVFALIANEWYFWALGIFAIAAITDALDGYFARLLKQDTPLGRQLDPLVDKVIVSGCYIYLATNYQETGVMPWMVTAIVVRELLIQGLRSHLEGRGQAFGARMAGKLKTVFQCFSICLVLLCLALPSEQPILRWTRDGLTWLAVILTIYSGLSYVWIALPNFRRET